MAEEMSDDDDFDGEESDELSEDFEEVEIRQITFKDSAAARRRVEQLIEERALARLLKGDFDDWA